MSLKTFFLILVASIPTLAEKKVVFTSLDFNLSDGSLPSENEMLFGYSRTLFDWQEWLARKTSGPLLVPIEPPMVPIEVFEAKAAGIIFRPISFFSQALLHNVETLRSIDPTSSHTEVSRDNFTVQTSIPFPISWSAMIRLGKIVGRLAEKTTDKIVVISEFRHVDLKVIPPNPATNGIIDKLNIYKNRPDTINFQGMIHFNQIAKFGSMVSLFYGLDPQRTLVVNYFVIGIKRMDLNKGITDMDVRKILMGESLNTESGIGAGIPKYVEDLFHRFYELWE